MLKTAALKIICIHVQSFSKIRSAGLPKNRFLFTVAKAIVGNMRLVNESNLGSFRKLMVSEILNSSISFS